MRSTYSNILASAGFSDVESFDQSVEYAETIRRWQSGWAAREQEVRAVIGDDEFDRRFDKRAAALKAIEDGVLMRSLHVARRPPLRTRSA